VGPSSLATVQTACGLAAETTLVAPEIVTGRGDAVRLVRDSAPDASAPVRLRIAALGISTSVVPVGIDVHRGVLGVP
jgi:hypothetical protein